MRVKQFIQFFEDFAKNHADIGHLQSVDVAPVPPQSTEQNSDPPIRFKSILEAHIFNALANKMDASYRSTMFVALFDGKPYNEASHCDFNKLQEQASITVLRETPEDNENAIENAMEINWGIVYDLMRYLVATLCSDCHPFGISTQVQSMKYFPEEYHLDTSAYGWTLEFQLLREVPEGIRSGKFRAGFLPVDYEIVASPLSFAPTTATGGDTITINATGAVQLELSEEVRIGNVRIRNTTTEIFFTFQPPNSLLLTVPTGIAPGAYFLTVETTEGAWFTDSQLTIT